MCNLERAQKSAAEQFVRLEAGDVLLFQQHPSQGG